MSKANNHVASLTLEIVPIVQFSIVLFEFTLTANVGHYHYQDNVCAKKHHQGRNRPRLSFSVNSFRKSRNISNSKRMFRAVSVCDA